jgi:hypothetical protein
VTKEAAVTSQTYRAHFDGLVTIEGAPVPPEPPEPSPYPPPIHPPDDDIRSILEMPGGPNPVTVKDGEYKAGAGVFPHDQRLVVVAEHPGEVMLNLHDADLTLEAGSSNIALCGLAHRDGTIMSNADDFTLWYHDGRFDVEVWHQMWLDAGGDMDAIRTMTHSVCKGVWIGQNTQGRQLRNNRLLGCDIHDCGDDGVFIDKCSGAVIAGHRIWNIDEKGLDPGYSPWGPGDLFHNDSVQVPGAVDLALVDGWQQCNTMLGGDNASSTFTIARVWAVGCGGVGLSVDSAPVNSVVANVADVTSFSNGMAFKHDDGWNTLLTEWLDDAQAIWPNVFNVPGRLITNISGTNSDKHVLPGFATDSTGRYLLDPLAPKNDPRNPALVWRHAHLFEQWRELLPTDARGRRSWPRRRHPGAIGT